MALGVSLHEQGQALFSQLIVYLFMFKTAGQGTADQNLSTIADPVAYRLKASGRATQFEQHAVDGCGQVGD